MQYRGLDFSRDDCIIIRKSEKDVCILLTTVQNEKLSLCTITYRDKFATYLGGI